MNTQLVSSGTQFLYASHPHAAFQPTITSQDTVAQVFSQTQKQGQKRAYQKAQLHVQEQAPPLKRQRLTPVTPLPKETLHTKPTLINTKGMTPEEVEEYYEMPQELRDKAKKFRIKKDNNNDKIKELPPLILDICKFMHFSRRELRSIFAQPDKKIIYRVSRLLTQPVQKGVEKLWPYDTGVPCGGARQRFITRKPSEDELKMASPTSAPTTSTTLPEESLLKPPRKLPIPYQVYQQYLLNLLVEPHISSDMIFQSDELGILNPSAIDDYLATNAVKNYTNTNDLINWDFDELFMRYIPADDYK